MKHRSVKSVIYAGTFDMGGMPVRQAFPSQKAEAPDPFLLLHHADVKVPQHIPVTQSGVGPHPHRGFSPVTFVLKGGVHHRDSRGNNNIVYEGGTQWMNAGMGVIHSERPPHDIFEKGGRQEILQLWVNTPAAHKMDQPSYQPLNAEDTPFVESEDKKVRVNIHSGELNGVRGPIHSYTVVNTFTMKMEETGKFLFNIPSEHNAFVYVLHGQVQITDDASPLDENFVSILNNDGEVFELTALKNSIVFVGTGAPLNEPIASQGPFVMNNSTQLMEALRDYQLGKMGVLIEE